jgi:O-acetyl-ADP-ribose deacetylase (regulator of RNase III)
VLVVLAIVGIFPTGSKPPFVTLNSFQRISFLIFAAVLLLIPLIPIYRGYRQGSGVETNEEYQEQFEKARIRDITALREQLVLPTQDRIIADRAIGHARYEILVQNIVESNVQVLVSSDDNCLQAKGGVAKAILDAAGLEVLSQIAAHRKDPPAQGYMVVTTGGSTRARAIVHPAIIDLEKSRYPDQALIRKVVRRCLDCAAALGATSIAFPVLGGGTASKYLTPWDSIRAITAEVVDYLKGSGHRYENRLEYVVLYVFNRNDLEGDVNLLLDQLISAN